MTPTFTCGSKRWDSSLLFVELTTPLEPEIVSISGRQTTKSGLRKINLPVLSSNFLLSDNILEQTRDATFAEECGTQFQKYFKDILL